MFGEGSPKESHKLIVGVGVVAALALFAASFNVEIVYRVQGREIVLNDASGWAAATGIIVAALLIAWHRGWISESWPLAVGAGSALLVLLFVVGDWLTATRGADRGIQVSASFYVALVASLVIAITCGIGLWRPAVERSESRGEWERERQRSRGPRDG